MLGRAFMEGQLAGVTSSRWDCQMTAGCVAASSLPWAIIEDPVTLCLTADSGAAASACALLALPPHRFVLSRCYLTGHMLARHPGMTRSYRKLTQALMGSPKSGRKLAVALQGLQPSHRRFCGGLRRRRAATLQA